MKQIANKEKINRDIEKQEISVIVQKISDRLKKVPPSVLNGSFQTAVQWKAAAKSAMQATNAKTPSLQKIQEKFAALDAFYPSDFSLESA